MLNQLSIQPLLFLSFSTNLLKIQQVAICVVILPFSWYLGEHTTLNKCQV